MSRIWDALQKVEDLREAVPGQAPVDEEQTGLTVTQRTAIQALLRTATIAEAAQAVGVTDRTLRRWLARPGFVAAYYAAGRAEIETSLQRLGHSTETALAVLAEARELLQGVRDRTARRSREGADAPRPDDPDRPT
jgi:transposase-like protein